MAYNKSNYKKERDEVEVIRMSILKPKKDSHVLALCSVRVGNVGFQGVKVCANKKGELFVGFPQHQGTDKDGKDAWFSDIWFDTGDKNKTADLYQEVREAVLTEFNRKCE